MFDFGFSYIAGKGFFDVSDASSNVVSGALGKHLDSTIRTVADKAGQLITVGYVKSGEAKADTLDSTDENYLFGSLAHLDTRYSMLDSGIEYFDINLKQVSMQVCILTVDNSQIY